jgi:hypothetical protein
MKFIKVYERTLSLGLIQDCIDWSDRPATELKLSTEADGDTQFEDKGKLGRDDHQKFLKFSNTPLMDRINKELLPYFEDYRKQFPGVKGGISYEIKLQKTPIQGGYSVWHCEQGPGMSATRALSWMVYLNDVEDGGDTEFLYQSFKQKAVKGTLVIWPAAFTHTHRGNPPYSNVKYIVTGWINFPYEYPR